MGMHSPPKEEIAKELLGWTIDDFGYIDEGFFLDLSQSNNNPKRVNIIATDLGMGIDSVIDLKTKIKIAKGTYDLLYVDLWTAIEDHGYDSVKRVVDNEFVGFEVGGFKTLLKKEDFDVKMMMFREWNSLPSVVLWGSEELFRKVMMFINIDLLDDTSDINRFLTRQMSPEEIELFVKVELGDEAWGVLKDIIVKEKQDATENF